VRDQSIVGAGHHSNASGRVVDQHVLTGREIEFLGNERIDDLSGERRFTAFLEEKGHENSDLMEQGLCGTRKVKNLEGEADHRDCVCRRSRGKQSSS
jgi:hypothetical protein